MGFQGLGVEVLPQKTGRPVRVSSDGQPEWKAIGVTPVWDAIAPAAAYSELEDGLPVYVGEKAFRYGTILSRITAGVYQNLYLPYNTGPAVANPTLAPAPVDGGAGALAAGTYSLGYAYRNANGTTMISPLGAVTIGANRIISVPLIVFPYGVDSVDWYFSKAANNADVAFLINRNTGAAFTINALPAGGAAEEPGANTTQFAGVGTLRRGECGICDRSIKNINRDAMHLGLMEGGYAYRQRLLVDGAGQPSMADLLEALPRLRLSPHE